MKEYDRDFVLSTWNTYVISLLTSARFWSLRDVHSTGPCIMKGCQSYTHVPMLQTRNESLALFLADLQRNWCRLAIIQYALISHEGDTLITDPEMIKSVTKDYWSKLYMQQDMPDIPKPWISTQSVVNVWKQVEAEPFQWPVPSNIADFWAMLWWGNHWLPPGPDEWEKWCIKNLSDFALSLVLDLHNYEVMNSKFSGDIKNMWLTYLYKRGTWTDLVNYRGLMLSNFLANSPMTWLNSKLVPYVAKLNIIPETQVATQ